MWGLESLDVLIGIVTVYAMFALACTAIVEALASWFDIRSANLEAALKELFAGNLAENKPFVDAFYEHPLVETLSKGDSGRPSYISPDTVGRAVYSLLASGSVPLADGINNLPDKAGDKPNRIKGLLVSLSAQAPGDGEAFRRAVAKHFDAAMDRASGWTKRHQQKVALLVSAVLVCFANVDTVSLFSTLSANPALRAKVISLAEGQSKDKAARPAGKDGKSGDESATAPDKRQDKGITDVTGKSEGAANTVVQAAAALESAGLQLGWRVCPSGREWVAKIVGLLITIFAVSLGAPFWFDLLQRFMRVRQAGISPRDKKTKRSGA